MTRNFSALARELRVICIMSVWSSGAIWQLRSGTALAREMACCLITPMHCLNQSNLRFSEIIHSHEKNITGCVHYISLYQDFDNYIFETMPVRYPSANSTILSRDVWTEKLAFTDFGDLRCRWCPVCFASSNIPTVLLCGVVVVQTPPVPLQNRVFQICIYDYFPSYTAAREMNTNITLEWRHSISSPEYISSPCLTRSNP